MNTGRLRWTIAVAAMVGTTAAYPNQSTPLSSPSKPGLEVRIVTDEADAVLAVLAKKQQGQAINDDDWRRLFASEGYVRLKKRESEMKRPFQDAEFQAFVVSENLAARAEALRATLDRWKGADLAAAARRALAYLPEGARLKASIYPVIKPRDNSFVFEVKSNPAIFLFLDPEVTSQQFENTLAHELHHIGYGGSCPTTQTRETTSRLPDPTQSVINWIGAFGEGLAMLAAAGGPDVHPHQFSKAEDRARWDRDVSNFNEDLKKVDGFFNDILAGKMSREDERQTAFSFFGVQGPWYTVGWKMAVTIEKTYGRPTLIEYTCDYRKLLPAFNRAVAASQVPRTSTATWSPSVIKAITSEPVTKSPIKSDFVDR